jgi:hypothetical protein
MSDLRKRMGYLGRGGNTTPEAYLRKQTGGARGDMEGSDYPLSGTMGAGKTKTFSNYELAIAASQDILSKVTSLRRKIDEAHRDGIFDPQLYRHLVRSAQDMDTTMRSFELSMESVYKNYGGYFYNPAEGMKGKIKYGF